MRLNMLGRWSRWLRGISAAAVFAVLLVSALLHPARAGAYNCRPNHCYGFASWNGARNSFAGSDTTILVVPLSYQNAGGDFINHEMWLQDEHNGACGGNLCWVEAGYTYGSVAGGPIKAQYFWAHQRPNLGYNEFAVGDIPASDYWNNTDFSIARDPNNASWYNVMIRSSVPGSVYSVTTSTSNPMQPEAIHTGTELSGFQGANSPQARFTYNRWIANDYNKYYQTSDGVVIHNDPPWTTWGAGYAPSQTTTGGQLYSSCC